MGVPPAFPKDKLAPIYHNAPQKPNAYCDGSVQAPKSGYLATGTFAAIYPRQNAYGRTLPTRSEQAYRDLTILTDETVSHVGLQIGPYPSSTRVEALGLLLLLRLPVQVHAALDNKAVVAQFRAIAAQMYREQSKPWLLRLHGDVYAAIARTLTQRTSRLATAKWSKGHATEEDVAAAR